jgi:hypothetical protein
MENKKKGPNPGAVKRLHEAHIQRRKENRASQELIDALKKKPEAKEPKKIASPIRDAEIS